MNTLIPAFLTLTLILTSGLFAQDAVPVTEEPVCNDEFAKFLVDQQVSESRSVGETDKRVRILTKAADFLWKFDQARSREYFTEAYKVATERFKEKGFERKEYGGGISSNLPDYRFEVVKTIARHAVILVAVTNDLLEREVRIACDLVDDLFIVGELAVHKIYRIRFVGIVRERNDRRAHGDHPEARQPEAGGE